MEQKNKGLKENLEEIDRSVMAELKNFQRATVEHIDTLYRSGFRRILVADEVGMGKTLVAKGVVSKVACLRKEEGNNLVKVVYICSNATIAGQNLGKLKIDEEVAISRLGDSRLSMQHLVVQKQENEAAEQKKYIQLIPLTPGTSFDIRAGEGIVSERALIYSVMVHMPEFQDPQVKKTFEELMRFNAPNAWDRWARKHYEWEVWSCNEKSPEGSYLEQTILDLRNEFIEEAAKCTEQQMGLEDIVSFLRCPESSLQNKKSIIAKLRRMFARISVKRLDPDLVILDEFQRFKNLLDLDDTTETGMLTQKVFATEDLRILLLSATPFRLYTTMEELSSDALDSSFHEFIKVMKFLEDKPGAQKREASAFFTIWEDYVLKLKSYSLGANTVIIEAKQGAEAVMRERMARTERCSTNELTQIIDTRNTHVILDITEHDVASYLSAQSLIKQSGLSANMPIDYIKSCPFPFSFMRGYRLLDKIESAFAKSNTTPKLPRKKWTNLWIDKAIVDNYQPLVSPNAKFERLKQDVFTGSPQELLWIPPSLPYYQVEKSSPFYGVEGYSKTLVFSSWAMVPRMATTLLSYEAERRIVSKLKGSHYRYFKTSNDQSGGAQDEEAEVTVGSEEEDATLASPKLPQGLLKYPRNSEGSLCLMYPSKYLASLFDPVKLLNDRVEEPLNIRLVRTKLKAELKTQIAQIARELGVKISSRAKNPRWFVLLAMFLDRKEHFAYFQRFWEALIGRDDTTVAERDLVSELNERLSDGYQELGAIPNEAADILTNMAIASPAICALRIFDALSNQIAENNGYDPLLPFKFGNALRTKLNTAMATIVVKSHYRAGGASAHWKNVLRYCVDGNLQAVLDEYVHLLFNTNARGSSWNIIGNLFDVMVGEPVGKDKAPSFHKADTHYEIQTFDSFKKKASGAQVRRNARTSLRTNFAGAFSKGEDEKTVDRRSLLRNAFNSPFRPFVLISTSIGQEGLDFHHYCRRIVHWNLPSNPIDLEQREGRINRYKCLAIRRSISERYKGISFSKDIWSEMFAKASEVENAMSGAEKTSELIPYWGLAKGEFDDLVKIERYVYEYPFSKDSVAYERLIKILAEYRAVLGQPGQEELLEKLNERFLAGGRGSEELSELFINLSPFCFAP